MRKSLSLLAIVGLLLSIGLVVNASASAPVYNDIPDMKLFLNQGLTPAFDLANFNTGPDAATTYSVLTNFLGKTGLTGSNVNEGDYSSVTVGRNAYTAANIGGTATAANKVKWTTYKIKKLPKVGLNPGSSYTVGVSNYSINSAGSAIPPSFGNAASIIVSDPTKVTASWSGNTSVVITMIAAATGPVNVDVIAAAVASAPYGTNIDMERIQVNTNILANSTFSTANDTSAYGLELAPGRTVMAAPAYLANYTDTAGTQANGVYCFTFTSGSDGIKATAFPSNYFSVSSGSWYIARWRVTANAGNTHQGILFLFDNVIASAVNTDVAANVYFGVPSVWTWIETPVYIHSNSSNGYPQFQFKATAAGTAYIDELQVVKAAPTLIDASRGNTRLFYGGGDFDAAADTTQWGQQGYPITAGATNPPGISVNNALVLNFAGASGANLLGIKWTASTTGGAGGVITTPAATVGREVGVRATVVRDSGNTGSFNTLGIILVAGYGVTSNGSATIASAGTNLIAAAQVGSIVDGSVYTVGKATSPFYQFQFGLRSDAAGILDVSKADYISDNDDPNFGDQALFP